jgi:coenzyme PQQ biosynthesis protein PqqD
MVAVRCDGAAVRGVRVNATERPAFGKGVRLRRETDGSAMLLVPEGAFMLNGAAAAALDLVDGRRTLDEIVERIVARYDVSAEQARSDVADLFDRLCERRLLVTS